ncbi:MAG: alpha-1,2-fucosyltransferase [Lachnospiraceae bacterium]|nr:alpha-1,2-fucosyltransferase [Lachnospiraceae bacterium]
MHVVQLMGGLGNQMFQYALYRELLSQGKTAMIEDESGYKAAGTREKHLQKAFAINYKRPSEEEMRILTDSSMRLSSRIRRKLFGRKSKSFVEKQFNFNPDVFLQESAYYEGYWQSDKYFKDVMEELRGTFTFHCDIPEASQNVLEKIDSKNAVSIHIRRGDYLDEAQIGAFGGICTESYYRQAVNLMKEKVPQASFFIFTNDPAYVKEHISGEVFEVVDCNDEAAGYLDMLLMSRCKHHIIANSSFSWWGAWLCDNPDKIVIAPDGWLNDRDCSDIYTEGMLVISGNI